MNQRNCRECDNPLYGRSDKKFCSDYCRNTFNNRLNEDSNSYMRKVNRVMRKNRKILADLVSQQIRIIKRSELKKQGFSFHHHTSIKQGENMLYYCYDLSYSLISEKKVIIYTNEDQSSSPS